MGALTGKQREALDCIRQHLAGHGYPPSIREVSRAMGLSVHGAECHLRALERKGFVTRDRRVARSLRIVERPEGE